ncbi:MAG: cysteine-rich CWC family protein [Bacteroidota bacterium]|nr:MAG: cysteine-rich CWC family protein [Bacteroidota bacterium]
MVSIKKCPSCGKEFSCMGENDCWCETVQLHKKQFLILNQKFSDCICPDCMKQYESE